MVKWKMPKEIVGGVKRIQKELMSVIASKHIALECCPISNYMIGHFDKYVDLPVMRFFDDQEEYKVSLNTDDKGIVVTSIENEYALMIWQCRKNDAIPKKLRITSVI